MRPAGKTEGNNEKTKPRRGRKELPREMTFGSLNLFSVAHVAEILNKHPFTIKRYLKTGKIKGILSVTAGISAKMH